MLIGDSFVHGACVDEENTLSSQLNKINIPSFSISYGGNGPLLELATLIEYVIVVKPKIILWFYSENDLFDLNNEKESEMIWYFFREMDDEVYGMVTDWLLNKWDEFKENVR